ncbi:MAG: hypothetical protein K6G11_10075, partial [Lachnospiraceae bacterium]|nr:hypothetical protein [Lachnospiraceae bacterium]
VFKAPCSDDGHDFGEWVTVDPGCTAMGYQYRVCSNCGQIEYDNYTQALGHEYITSTDENGNTVYTCTRCGDTYTEEKASDTTENVANATEVPAGNTGTGASTDTTNTTASAGTTDTTTTDTTNSSNVVCTHEGDTVHEVEEATCTHARIHYIYCADCNELIEKYVTGNKLDHDWEEISSNSKYITYECSECGKTVKISTNVMEKKLQNYAINNIKIVKTGKNAYRATWNTLKKAPSYQIRAAGNKGLTVNKDIEEVKKKRYLIDDSDLKYFRIRSIFKLKGVVLYGNWSKVTAIKETGKA